MAEGCVNLFENDHDNTNRPHFKGYLKIDGVDHEFALWPNKDGKKGFSGKYKPKQAKEVDSNVTQADADLAWEEAKKKLESKTKAATQPIGEEFTDSIPF